jgi:hypothetical protein
LLGWAKMPGYATEAELAKETEVLTEKKP